MVIGDGGHIYHSILLFKTWSGFGVLGFLGGWKIISLLLRWI